MGLVKFIAKLAVCGLCFYGGYEYKEYRLNHKQDYRVVKQNDNYWLQKNESGERRTINSDFTVGDLEQQLYALSVKNPEELKKGFEDLKNKK